LQYGADLFAKTISGDTALSLTTNVMIRLDLFLIKERGIEKKSLILACYYLDNRRVEELIAEGVDLNQTDKYGLTPLMYVVGEVFLRRNSEKKELPLAIMRSLLKAGADPNIVANDGNTALERAGGDDVKKIIRNHNLAQGRQKVLEILEEYLADKKAGEKELPKLILELAGTYEPIQ